VRVFIGVHATWAKDKDGVLFFSTVLYQMFGLYCIEYSDFLFQVTFSCTISNALL
jgi:hypothetical protein